MPTTEEARLGWLALALTPGLGPTRSFRAVKHLGDNAARVFTASLTELEATNMPAASAQHIIDGRSRSLALTELARAAEHDAQILCPDDDHYPAALLEIFDPPTVLWVRGNTAALSLPGIAVVGTRQPTPYGEAMARTLSRDLARRGLAIFSGMARGVDTEAHRGALEAKGAPTVAVWGTGIDIVYPRENRKLADEIVASNGAILSEFAIGTAPTPQNFPIRNRTLSGMSCGVLVVEAAEHSGTRITARCALEQGRDVYAVPGNVTTKNAWGPNTLIRQGAKLTATWEDVWEDLPSQTRIELEDTLLAKAPTPAATGALFNTAPQLSSHEAAVLTHLRADQSTQLDDLIERLEGKLASAEIFTALFELELAGRIRSLPGKNYVLTFGN